MVYLLNIFVTFALSLFSLSLFPNLTFFNTVPLLPLFFVITLTYFRKGVEPVLLAAFSGIVLDFFSSYGFGLYLGLFLGVAVLVRILFQEGMKELSFTAFVMLAALALVVCYLAQVLLLVSAGVDVSFMSLVKPFLQFLFVNVIFVLIMYPSSNWYFEKVAKLESYQKRR